MGYPMTFQRFLNRNRLQDGGYDKAPAGLRDYCQPRGYGGGWSDGERVLLDAANRERRELDQLFRLLAGDLRRLQADAADEVAVCKHIASRTGLSEDVVAAVLKEFVGF